MDILLEALGPGVGNQVYVLHGVAGCGKTTIAYEIFEQVRQRGDRVALWVNGSDSTMLRSGMRLVAADREPMRSVFSDAQFGSAPAPADLVWERLDRSGEPWLLVLDNVDDPEILEGNCWLRNSPAGTVIVTSRDNSSWWPGVTLLPVGPLPRDDAARVLQDFVPDSGSFEVAARVADRLDRLPLILVRVGESLANKLIDPWTLGEFERRLAEGADMTALDLVEQGNVAAGIDSGPLNRVWQLSFDVLSRSVPESVQLLRLLACWAGDPLPVSVLAGRVLDPVLPASRVDAALSGLLRQSFTGLGPGSSARGCLSTHAVILESVFRNTSSAEREVLASTAADLLKRALPEVPERGPQAADVIMLEPHAMALLRRAVHWRLCCSTVEAAVECVFRMVVAIHRSGDYESALALAKKARGLAVRSLDENNINIIRLDFRIGASLSRLGVFDGAEIVLRGAAEKCEECFGENFPETLEGYLRLAGVMVNTGKSSEAIELMGVVVEGRARIFGYSHKLTLIARGTLLSCALESEMSDILKGGPGLVDEFRDEFGDGDQNTAWMKLGYAFALYRKGDLAEALFYVRSAFSHCRDLIGADHPLTLNARRTLAAVLGAMTNHGDAIEHLKEVIKKREEKLGQLHPWVAQDRDLLERFREARRIALANNVRIWIKERDVGDLLNLYGDADAPTRASVQSLGQLANVASWHARSSDVIQAWFEPFLGLESAASMIWFYESQSIPGLFQTAGYAREALLAAGGINDMALEQRIAIRIKRQALLLRPDPPRIWVVVDEAVLRRSLGGRNIMRSQIARLLEVASLPHVTLQILPDDRRPHRYSERPFTVLRFAEREVSDVVYLEGISNAAYLSQEEDVDYYNLAMSQLGAYALPPELTPKLLMRIMGEL